MERRLTITVGLALVAVFAVGVLVGVGADRFLLAPSTATVPTTVPTSTPSPIVRNVVATPTPVIERTVTPVALVASPTAPPTPTPERTVRPAVATATPAPTTPPTNTPIPTPTRRPLRVTKLGIGVYDGGDRMRRALDVMRPSVILVMDPNVDWAKKVRKEFPKAFIVGRIYAKDQPLDNPTERGAAFADEVAKHAVPLKGVVDAWMSYNEVTGHRDYNTYVAYNEFQIAFARRLQDHYGIPAVAGNDATATVDIEDYPKYFRGAIEASAYFGLHLYAPKGVKSLRDPAGQEIMLRYRAIKAALDREGVKHGPFVITEIGLWDGWRDFTSAEEMANDFIWYAEEQARDPYVAGSMIFGLFETDRREWWTFNILDTSILDRIGEYNTEPAP